MCCRNRISIRLIVSGCTCICFILAIYFNCTSKSSCYLQRRPCDTCCSRLLNTFFCYSQSYIWYCNNMPFCVILANAFYVYCMLPFFNLFVFRPCFNCPYVIVAGLFMDDHLLGGIAFLRIIFECSGCFVFKYVCFVAADALVSIDACRKEFVLCCGNCLRTRRILT